MPFVDARRDMDEIAGREGGIASGEVRALAASTAWVIGRTGANRSIVSSASAMPPSARPIAEVAMDDLLDDLDGRRRRRARPSSDAVDDRADTAAAADGRPPAAYIRMFVSTKITHQSPSWLRRICAFMTSQSSTGSVHRDDRLRRAVAGVVARVDVGIDGVADDRANRAPSRAAIRFSRATCSGDRRTWVRSREHAHTIPCARRPPRYGRYSTPFDDGAPGLPRKRGPDQLGVATPGRAGAHSAASSSTSRTGSVGSAKIAVPTWTATAPTARKSRTSASSVTPPIATTGMLTTWPTS